MKYTIVLIIGMVLLVVGAQGAVRLLFDHDNAGLLNRMPGGFGTWLACYVVLTVVGIGLAGWGSRRNKQADGDA